MLACSIFCDIPLPPQYIFLEGQSYRSVYKEQTIEQWRDKTLWQVTETTSNKDSLFFRKAGLSIRFQEIGNRISLEGQGLSLNSMTYFEKLLTFLIITVDNRRDWTGNLLRQQLEPGGTLWRHKNAGRP